MFEIDLNHNIWIDKCIFLDTFNGPTTFSKQNLIAEVKRSYNG